MDAYSRVQAARSNQRPDALHFINALVQGFVELHGDRRFADDPAMVAGVGWFEDMPVTVLALEKGVDTPDRLRRNFGSAQPEGYRKSLWHLRQAEKFGRPVLCFIDTAGAACGIGAEERGQGQAIAENLWEMMGLKVPVLSLIIGEGGSGGALALAAASRVWMLENAVYSVLSPEGAASIIYKDAGKVKEASEALKLSAEDMLRFGVIEGIVLEHKDTLRMMVEVRHVFREALSHYSRMTGEQISGERYARFRRMGGEPK